MVSIKKNKRTNIVVQGLGFVGSAMAVAIASRRDEKGENLFNVTGIDLNNYSGNDKINKINSGTFPFETNDQQLINETKKCIEQGSLSATSDISIYSKADIIVVNINCDLIVENGERTIQLSNFIDGIKSIANQIKEHTLVIVESTIPPGTCEKIIYPIFLDSFKKRKLNIKNFSLAHSYERVMPGKNYLDSIINYWRVFAGIDDTSADNCAEFLSKVINVRKYPLTRLSNTNESETGKLLENSYRAVNIAFIEEWGRFAEDIGLDLFNIIDAIKMRPTHNNIMQPGFGVGGYCLTKDPIFAKIAAKEIFNLPNHEFHFSSTAIEVNKKMPLVIVDKIKKYFGGSLQGINILLLGATYRQDVGDTRFSPSKTFLNAARSENANVSVYDPMVDDWEGVDIALEKKLPKANDYDVIVFAVKHKEFKKIDLSLWANNSKILIHSENYEIIDNFINKKYLINIDDIKKHKETIVYRNLSQSDIDDMEDNNSSDKSTSTDSSYEIIENN